MALVKIKLIQNGDFDFSEKIGFTNTRRSYQFKIYNSFNTISTITSGMPEQINNFFM